MCNDSRLATFGFPRLTYYGFGVDLSLDRNLSLNVEYMNYYDKDSDEISGFSIGIASKI